MTKRRPLSPTERTQRRADARAEAKLADDRARLATLEPGGAAGRPVEVASASVVEVRAAAMPCTRCANETRVELHEAVEHEGRVLRRVVTRCKQCGRARTLWFAIAERLPN